MNKLAFFVEGQTELLFLEKLLMQIANKNSLIIDAFTACGGKRVPFKMTHIRKQEAIDSRHYVQIVDCTSDGNVKSYIGERYEGLSQQKFWAAIGLRDVYPTAIYSQVESFRKSLAYGVKTSPVRVEFILGIMEVESWFLAEDKHFFKIDPRLSRENIAAHIGYDPVAYDVQLRLNPAADLHKIYHSRPTGLRVEG